MATGRTARNFICLLQARQLPRVLIPNLRLPQPAVRPSFERFQALTQSHGPQRNDIQYCSYSLVAGQLSKPATHPAHSHLPIDLKSGIDICA